MSFIYSPAYLADLVLARKTTDYDFLRGKTLALSGATGLIGSYLIDLLLGDTNLEVTIHALVRDKVKAYERFQAHRDDARLIIDEIDLSLPIMIDGNIDYVIHGASITSPHEYGTQPIATMLTNFVGNKTMLDLAVIKKARYMFISTTEIHGQADEKPIKEDYLGYLDLLDVRSGYNEAKRASETLCVAYAKEKVIEVVIPRLSRTFGPTQKPSDRKAMTQFLTAGRLKQPIVIKSAGTQKFSYTYVSDAVSGLLFVLERGKSGEAYNVASEEVLPLKEVAELIGSISGSEVMIEPQQEKGMAYSKAGHAILSIEKIKHLGWKPQVSLKDGICRTFSASDGR